MPTKTNDKFIVHTYGKVSQQFVVNTYGHVPEQESTGNYGNVPSQNFECFMAYSAKISPENKSNQQYWIDLAQARALEIQKRQVAPANLKALAGDDYALESMDPKHRIGELLNLFLDEYNFTRPTQPFFEWIDSMSPMNQVKLIQRVMEKRISDKHTYGVVKPEWIRAFNNGVQYMDQQTRRSFSIQINDGLLYQNGEIFDTSNLRTEFSGVGTAIFVQSAVGTFYSSSHVWGRQHHSSFLSGAAVKSAGEWVVTNGKLISLSGKSGHYKPTMNQLLAGIRDLKTQNAVNDASAIVYSRSHNTDTMVPASSLESRAHEFMIWQDSSRPAGYNTVNQPLVEPAPLPPARPYDEGPL